MKIIYKENPLETIVELDDSEKEILRLKIKAEIISEDADMASYYLQEEHFDLEKARDYIGYVCKHSESDEYLEKMTDAYLETLTGTHGGDCTCFPASCPKCHVENMLGIDTISGLGSHQAHQIFYEFREYETIDEVIKSLENHNPQITDAWKNNIESWNANLPRWKKEAKQAAEWLKNYKKEKLNSGI